MARYDQGVGAFKIGIASRDCHLRWSHLAISCLYIFSFSGPRTSVLHSRDRFYSGEDGCASTGGYSSPAHWLALDMALPSVKEPISLLVFPGRAPPRNRLDHQVIFNQFERHHIVAGQARYLCGGHFYHFSRSQCHQRSSHQTCTVAEIIAAFFRQTKENSARTGRVKERYGILERLKLPALGLVLVMLTLSIVFWRLDIRSSFEPPYLFLTLSIVFIGAASLITAIIAGRSFLHTGAWPVLWMGAGALPLA